MSPVTGKRKRNLEDDEEHGSGTTDQQRVGHEPSGKPILSELQSNSSLEDLTSESSSISTDEGEGVAAEDEETSSSGLSDDDDLSDRSSGESTSGDIIDPTGISSQSSKAGTQPPTIPDIRSRLSELLPQLRQANAHLQSLQDQQLDNVADDEEHYIEMDLGLGVLKEMKPLHDDDIRTAADEDDSSDDSSAESEPDAIQKLLKTENLEIPEIEEVDTG